MLQQKFYSCEIIWKYLQPRIYLMPKSQDSTLFVWSLILPSPQFNKKYLQLALASNYMHEVKALLRPQFQFFFKNVQKWLWKVIIKSKFRPCHDHNFNKLKSMLNLIFTKLNFLSKTFESLQNFIHQFSQLQSCMPKMIQNRYICQE